MSKTTRLSHVAPAPSGRTTERSAGPSFELQGHQIRQIALATAVLSWVGIAFTLRLF